jgi:signal transduction histidine kinase
LYDQAQRSTDWLNASGEIARTLLADADEEVLMDVVSRALDIAGADYAGLIMPTDGERLRVTFAKGAGGEDFLGYEFDPVASPLGRAIIAGESICTPDLMNWANDDFVNRWDFGPAMLVPLADSDGARGAVLMIRHSQRAGFGSDDVMQASTFAAQVALALQLNDARADAEWLRVLEDRHRIAQDLHDNVMQRLFATGVGLQALADQRLDPDTGGRLRRYIADLDETIEQIRNRVFGLRANGAGGRRGRRGRFLRARPQPSDTTKVAQPAVLRTLSTTRMHSEGPPEVSA